MRLNFNYETMINSLPIWLESQKAKDERTALSDGTDNLNTVLQLNQQQTLAYNIVKKRFQEKDKLPLNLIITGQGSSGKSCHKSIAKFTFRHMHCCIILWYCSI